jgi:DNA-binding response OmpR family regulator
MSLTVVLAVGLDSRLLATHRALWTPAGFIVLSVVSIREAIDHFRVGDFDLVLLGHSMSRENKERLTFLIRASGSHTPVVSIADLSGDCDSFADATIANDSSALLTGMGQLLAKESQVRVGLTIAHGNAG